jgi:hypothetical protein
VNTPENKIVPELPKGYRPVEYVEPEAAEAAASFLANSKDRSANRMRKNMKALRVRVLLSMGPVVRIEDTDGKLHGYAWNTQAKVNDDLKLERRLTHRNARQLTKIHNRSAKHAVAADRRAAKATTPKIVEYYQQRAGALRNVSSAAKFELDERQGVTPFKNPDGN